MADDILWCCCPDRVVDDRDGRESAAGACGGRPILCAGPEPECGAAQRAVPPVDGGGQAGAGSMAIGGGAVGAILVVVRPVHHGADFI